MSPFQQPPRLRRSRFTALRRSAQGGDEPLDAFDQDIAAATAENSLKFLIFDQFVDARSAVTRGIAGLVNRCQQFEFGHLLGLFADRAAVSDAFGRMPERLTQLELKNRLSPRKLRKLRVAKLALFASVCRSQNRVFQAVAVPLSHLVQYLFDQFSVSQL